MNVSFTFSLKNRNTKTALHPILINVLFKSKNIPVNTGFKASSDNFDKITLIGNKDENYKHKNSQIRKQASDLERRILRYLDDGNTLDFETLRLIVRGDKNVIDKTLEDVKNEISRIYEGKVSKRTLQFWNTTVKIFNDFNNGQVKMSELKESFFIQYEGWRLKHKEGGKVVTASENTVWGDFKMIGSILNKAKKLGIIDHNPMTGLEKPKYKDTTKTYLQDEEIKKIEEYSETGAIPRYRNVAAWFVLSCYSGLRYEDLNRWDESKYIHNDRLYFSDEKEKTPHFVPLYPELMTAIERVRESKIPSNQKCNDYLKEIAVSAGIEKGLSMHVGRHTFAVRYLNKGGDIKVLQKLMGHKKLATTEVYGQITNKRIEDEVKRILG